MPYKVSHFGEITCPDCGKTIFKQSPNQKRCKACALVAHGETKIGLSPRPCKWCGEMITNPSSPAQKYHTGCYQKRKRQRATERMREYRKEKPYIFQRIRRQQYDKEYFDGLRDFVLARDNYTCQMCGTTDRNKLRVHHKDHNGRNVSKNQRNNKPDNLVTVCTSCHAKHHWFGSAI